MTLEEIMSLSDQCIMTTYGRLPIAFERGEGMRLWDTEGREYLDFLSGIAVCGAGHCHPQIVGAISEQAGKLMHTSNLYYIGLQAKLAKRLYDLSGGYKSFFCNSGTEAVEAAVKLARRHGNEKLGGKFEIISTEMSFHGRTYAGMTATGQERFHQGYEPLVPGFKYVPFNDIDALSGAISEETGAVLLEPIQGEGGVSVPDDAYLPAVRELCDKHGILLILDEVQTGLGRTGMVFAHEHFGIKADIITLAKTLGGGFPIGAILARPEIADTFGPGSHAATFGGNFVACAAALAYLELLTVGGLLESGDKTGGFFRQRLEAVQREFSVITDVRGKGLLLAIEFSEPIAKDVQDMCMATEPVGLITNALGDYIVRFEPPLIVMPAEIEQALVILRSAIGTVTGSKVGCSPSDEQTSYPKG